MSAPPDTLPASDGGDARFPRYLAAHAQVEADAGRLRATVRTCLLGEMPIPGRPLFALLGRPDAVTVNGRPARFVAAADASLSGGVWAADTVVRGRFELGVASTSRSLVAESRDGVELRAHMLDLGDGATYWDTVGAAGFLHDAYPLSVDLAIVGATEQFHVFSNGDVTHLGTGRWHLRHPRWYSPACPFLHALPSGTFRIARGARAGTTTRVIVPRRVEADPREVLARALPILSELRRRYGPWPHRSCHISVVEAGGMEHAGAVFSSSRDVRHELAHGYFGRWVLPRDGPSGWLDEAIAQWFQLAPGPLPRSTPLASSSMGSPTPWRRGNGPGAYTDGVRLLCLLDGTLRARGLELDTLLRVLASRFGGRHVSTSDFEAAVARLLPDDEAWVQRTFGRALHGDA